MFARRSRSSKATLRLFKTIIGWPRAFKYIICSESSVLDPKIMSWQKNRIGRTKLSLALALKHPSSYSEAEMHSQEWEDLLDRGELYAMDFLHTEPPGQ